MEVITAFDPPESPARVDPPSREPFRIGLVQERWHPDPAEHEEALAAGYYEDRYFRPGDSGYPVVDVDGARFGFPTCWDQWFPELARAYSLAGAEVIVYPTAIGSEPDHPGFDTEPLWERVITGNGIANGTFMVAINRVCDEP